MSDDAQQQPGSTIGTIASGLGKIAQYALPAALGAAMGGLGGAAAGAGMGAEGIQESQERDQERQMRQSELALRWQQFGLESQQAQMALASAKSWQDYTQTLPDEERAIAMENPHEYTKNKIEMGQWKLGLDTLKGDSTFAQAHKVDPNAIATIEALGPTLGKGVLDKYMESLTSGKYPNGVHVMTNKDGTTSLMGVGPNGETTMIASGVSPKTIPNALNTQQMNSKALNELNTFKGIYGAPSSSLNPFGDNVKWRNQAVSAMTAAGVDQDVAETVASSAAGVKPRATMPAKKGASASSDATTPTLAPKALWGKKHQIGGDGKYYDIDSMGHAKPSA